MFQGGIGQLLIISVRSAGPALYAGCPGGLNSGPPAAGNRSVAVGVGEDEGPSVKQRYYRGTQATKRGEAA
jgi:hypothetical protein